MSISYSNNRSYRDDHSAEGTPTPKIKKVKKEKFNIFKKMIEVFFKKR